MKSVQKIGMDKTEEMFELAKYAFNAKDTPARRARFQTMIEHSWCYGYFLDEVLTSQMMATPFVVRFGDQRYKMAGIGCVSSYPEFRGQGGINKIMTTLLAEINYQGVDLSYLAPFSYPFYRRYGYEYMFEKRSYRIQARDWPTIPAQTGRILRCQWEEAHQHIQKVYHNMKSYHYGALIREDWWLDYKFKQKQQSNFALYFDEYDEVQGYLVYQMKEETFKIVEWGYLNGDAFCSIANFIGTHKASFDSIDYATGISDSNLNYLFANPYLNVSVQPSMMAKIINFERFITRFEFKNLGQSITFQVIITEDAYCSWNEGFYEISMTDGGSTIKRKKERSPDMLALEGTIQRISQVFLGFRKVEELTFFGLIKCDPELSDFLDSSLKQQKLVLEDYF